MDDDSDDSTNMLTNNYETIVSNRFPGFRLVSAEILHQDSWHPGSDVSGLEAGLQRLTTENLQARYGDDMPKAGAVTESEYLGAISKKDKGPARQETPADVDGWQTYSHRNAKAHGQTPLAFTAFDPQGAAHRQTRPPSTVASEDFGTHRSNQNSRPSGYSQAGANKRVRYLYPYSTPR